MDNLRKWGGGVLESDTECSETDTLFVFCGALLSVSYKFGTRVVNSMNKNKIIL